MILLQQAVAVVSVSLLCNLAVGFPQTTLLCRLLSKEKKKSILKRRVGTHTSLSGRKGVHRREEESREFTDVLGAMVLVLIYYFYTEVGAMVSIVGLVHWV